MGLKQVHLKAMSMDQPMVNEKALNSAECWVMWKECCLGLHLVGYLVHCLGFYLEGNLAENWEPWLGDYQGYYLEVDLVEHWVSCLVVHSVENWGQRGYYLEEYLALRMVLMSFLLEMMMALMMVDMHHRIHHYQHCLVMDWQHLGSCQHNQQYHHYQYLYLQLHNHTDPVTSSGDIICINNIIHIKIETTSRFITTCQCHTWYTIIINFRW